MTNSAVNAYKLMGLVLDGNYEDAWKLLNTLSQRQVYEACISLAWAAAQPILSQSGSVEKARAVLAEFEVLGTLDPELSGQVTD